MEASSSTQVLSAPVVQEAVQPHSHSETLPSCVRCKLDITTGHAYELGDDKWHTECFACYKCGKQLSCDSDFLVLGTGTLICFDCSDSCKSCGKKIDDLAIILPSSNEAYCSDCFKCCKCGNKINDLRYAKTKRGLFCLACHERLLAKRKHYEEKKRRLTKHLPTIPPVDSPATDTPPTLAPAPLQSTPIPTPASPAAMKIPERSRDRPISPVRKRSNESGGPGASAPFKPQHKKEASIDGMLDATLERDHLHVSSPRNAEQTSIDNLSLEPLENLENDGVIDAVVPELIQGISPLLNGSEFSRKSSSSRGGLFAEALNGPPKAELGIPPEPFSGLGIMSGASPSDSPASRHSGLLSSPRSAERDLPLRTASANGMRDSRGPSAMREHDAALASPSGRQHSQTPVEHVQVYKTPALDFSSSQTHIRASMLPHTDLQEYNDDLELRETDTKIARSRKILHELEVDIESLREIKQQLMADITQCETHKETLTGEIDALKDRKLTLESFVPSSQEVKLPPPQPVQANQHRSQNSSPNLYDELNATKQQENVASVARQAKPKFWKIFGSNSPPKHSPLQKSTSSHGVSKLGGTSPQHQQTDQTHLAPTDKLKPFLNGKMSKSNSMQNVTNETTSDGKDLYGSTLVQRCHYEKAQVPNVLIKCIENIECDTENLKSEGLYRKSGSQAVIEQLERSFAKEQAVDLAEYDINVSTGILKRYLRKLPDPVITYAIYEPLIDVVRSGDMATKYPLGKNIEISTEEMTPIVTILKQLPKEHIYLLKVLSVHLEKVMNYKESNLMGLNNLALVFAPGLIRDLSGEKDILDMKERNYIIGFILEHYKQLFY